jgi:hypothetical protein
VQVLQGSFTDIKGSLTDIKDIIRGVQTDIKDNSRNLNALGRDNAYLRGRLRDGALDAEDVRLAPPT